LIREPALGPLGHAAWGTVDADSPWPGLAAFREQDQEFFCGRDAEIAELHRLVMREQVTLLFGLAGLGKTSLLQAGLFPRLREENLLPVPIRLDHSDGAAPLASQVKVAIAGEAKAHQIEAPASVEGESLWAHFHRVGSDYWSERNRLVVPVLVFDQFEEIFTHGTNGMIRAAASRAFLEELTELAVGRPPAALKAHLDENPAEAGHFGFSRHNYKLRVFAESCG